MYLHNHGLIAGKWTVVHNGHIQLAHTALKECEHVTILIVDSPQYAIPAYVRENWFRVALDPYAARLTIRIVPDLVGNDDSAAWAIHVRGYIHTPVDAVYSSDTYAQAFAGFLNAQVVQVERTLKGRNIRKDVLGNLDNVPSIVRAYFVKRVLVLGAESTGKSTLTELLAKYYRTNWVPEMARTYCDGRLHGSYGVWEHDEFSHFVTIQSLSEDMLARSANKVLFCDTNPFATWLWEKRYLGITSDTILQAALARHYDLCLIAGDEIPFVQDGTRDGEHIRHEMHRWFSEELTRFGIPFHIIGGTIEERLEQCIALVDPLLISRPF